MEVFVARYGFGEGSHSKSEGSCCLTHPEVSKLHRVQPKLPDHRDGLDTLAFGLISRRTSDIFNLGSMYCPEFLC
jgi:hypothetical protein